MDEETLQLKEQELREKHPERFSDPECQPNEICLGDCLVDVINIAAVNATILRRAGLTSARAGKNIKKTINGTGLKLEYRSIFADVREYITVAEKDNQPLV